MDQYDEIIDKIVQYIRIKYINLTYKDIIKLSLTNKKIFSELNQHITYLQKINSFLYNESASHIKQFFKSSFFAEKLEIIILFRPYYKLKDIMKIIDSFLKKKELISIGNTIDEFLFIELFDLCTELNNNFISLKKKYTLLNKNFQKHSDERWGTKGKIQIFKDNNQIDYANQELISESIEKYELDTLRNRIILLESILN